jgi:hypothetical protein
LAHWRLDFAGGAGSLAERLRDISREETFGLLHRVRVCACVYSLNDHPSFGSRVCGSPVLQNLEEKNVVSRGGRGSGAGQLTPFSKRTGVLDLKATNFMKIQIV